MKKQSDRKNFYSLPWGIFAGVSAMAWSFMTVGIVAVMVVSSMMIAEVGGDDGLSQSWWLYLMYVLDGLTILTFVASCVFCVVRKKRGNARLRKEPFGDSDGERDHADADTAESAAQTDSKSVKKEAAEAL